MSVYWPRADNLAVIPLACSKLGDPAVRQFTAAGQQVVGSGQQKTAARHRLHGIGLAAKESICRKPVHSPIH